MPPRSTTTSTARGRRYSWSVLVTDHRTLRDFLSDLPPFQSKYHITGSLKKALTFFPAHAAFAMLQANKLLLHFPAAIWTKLTAERKTLNQRYLALKEAEQIRKSVYSILRQEQRE